MAPVEPSAIFGVWRGASLPTGHPLDGLLEAYRWYGKAIESEESVHPLLFDAGHRGILAVEPAWLSVALPLRLPRLARSAAASRAFNVALPLLTARCPGARLARLPFRGAESAAMIYRRQPITDHFREVAPSCLLGAMERAGMAPFFFVLIRADAALSTGGGRIVQQKEG